MGSWVSSALIDGDVLSRSDPAGIRLQHLRFSLLYDGPVGNSPCSSSGGWRSSERLLVEFRVGQE